LRHPLTGVLKRERPVDRERDERDGEQPAVNRESYGRHRPAWRGQQRIRGEEAEQDEAADLQDLDRLAAPPHAEAEQCRHAEGADEPGDGGEESHQREEGDEGCQAEQDAHRDRLRALAATIGWSGAAPERAPATSRRIASRWMVRKSGFSGSLPARCKTMSPCIVAQNT